MIGPSDGELRGSASMSAALGPETKGLRMSHARSLAGLRAELAAVPRRVDDPLFSWPLLTLDDDALDHNVAAMASACRAFGVWHAPHVKAMMSGDLWRRQSAAGAWAATVAMPHQLRAARRWGVRRVLLANEMADARDALWLAEEVLSDPDFEVWLEVDSARGVTLLADALASEDAAVRARVHPLVEVGVPSGRSGTRTASQALALARQLTHSGLAVDGVIGYEGPVAHGTSVADLSRVQTWLQALIAIANELSGLRPRADTPLGQHPFVVSVGGSSYLDVVLPGLADLSARGHQGVVRAGAYVTHDHGHYAELDPWSRLPGRLSLQPAITIWGQVLSSPEPGLALLGAGRRDLPFDCGLPVPLWWRRPSDRGRLGASTPFESPCQLTKLDDQHAYLALDPEEPLRVGDIVGLGISHPCSAMDRWRVAAVTRGDYVIDLLALDF